jgi:endonuclease YncB( thermonuclease family)
MSCSTTSSPPSLSPRKRAGLSGAGRARAKSRSTHRLRGQKGGAHPPGLTIVDGDTVDVRLEGPTVRVRSVGVNTPETWPTNGGEPFGQEAEEANRRVVTGKTVRPALDVEQYDQYRRLLAPIDAGDMMIIAEPVRLGYA